MAYADRRVCIVTVTTAAPSCATTMCGCIGHREWMGAAAGFGLAAQSKRQGWLLVSGLSSLTAGMLGAITVAVLIVASVAIGLLLPSDWDSFDPDLRVGWAAYAFSIGSGINAVATLIVWFRRRRS